MSFYSNEEIRLIVASRSQFPDIIGISFEAGSGNEMIDIKLLFVFWPQFKTYIAFPVKKSDEGWRYIGLTMPDRWHRYLKRELRKHFGVRHLHRVNTRDNSQRVNQLIGLQYVTV